MGPTPFVNSNIRSIIANTVEDVYHICLRIVYEIQQNGRRGRGTVKSIEAYASPVFAFNYNARYETSRDLLPQDYGTIHPVSIFNHNESFWTTTLETETELDYIFMDDNVWSPNAYFGTLDAFFQHVRETYNYSGAIVGTNWLVQPSLEDENEVRTSTISSVSQSVMELIDKNSANIPEGDYLKMCDELKKLRTF
jgi:hypothetical protein